jgi:hypothetical protein
MEPAGFLAGFLYLNHEYELFDTAQKGSFYSFYRSMLFIEHFVCSILGCKAI